MCVKMPYCRNCGAEHSEGATVCPKCGQSVAGPPPPPTGPISRERRERYEKSEKGEKGEKEKREKEGDREKREKRETDRFGPIVGGFVLILLGLLFYLQWSNVISARDFGGYFMIGMGIILIVWALLRYTTQEFKGPAMGLLIGGIILGFIGLSTIYPLSGSWTWPLILIGLGLVLVVWSIAVYSRSPKPRQ